MHPALFKPVIPASEKAYTHALGRGYPGARTDTTQQSGQTPDKEVDLMFFWPCVMNWLYIDYQLGAPIIIYS